MLHLERPVMAVGTVDWSGYIYPNSHHWSVKMEQLINNQQVISTLKIKNWPIKLGSIVPCWLAFVFEQPVLIVGVDTAWPIGVPIINTGPSSGTYLYLPHVEGPVLILFARYNLADQLFHLEGPVRICGIDTTWPNICSLLRDQWQFLG